MMIDADIYIYSNTCFTVVLWVITHNHGAALWFDPSPIPKSWRKVTWDYPSL